MAIAPAKAHGRDRTHQTRTPTLNEAGHLLRTRDAAGAARACETVLSANPADADAWLLLARARQQQGDFPAMRRCAEQAAAIRPDGWVTRLLAAESLVYVGEVAAALAELKSAEALLDGNAPAWERLASLYAQLSRHRDSYRCAQRLQAIEPRRGAFLLSSAAIAIGRLDEAEALLDRIVARAPGEADAHYNRSTLRRQTAERNHVEMLESELARTPAGAPGEAPLRYALAKEYEDLGEHGRAFAQLRRGAAARRARLSYDVRGDVERIGEIISTFDRAWFDRQSGHEADGPVFIIGLPRTGTTLVDRILSAHSRVASLDEANDFTYALMCEAGSGEAGADFAARVRRADMAAVGRRYWSAMRGYGEDAPFLVNKTPANYLYLGLIAAALPGARVVHVRRDPMDACYAMYKTLFRMAYPFSYDLADLAAYHRAYTRLMDHMRSLLPPGRMIELDYEALVGDQEGESRRLIGFLGLDWEPACLDFHLNPSATATASAAQVRSPIHSRSVGMWRHYAEELEPLRTEMEATA